MWLKLKNNLYSIKTFWAMQNWFNNKVIGWFWKTAYKISYSFTQLNEKSQIFCLTLPSFLRLILCSAFIVCILIFIGKYEYYLPVGLQKDSGVNAEHFLIGIASISGIFLGLYFTAISSITSNYLLRAPQNVKNFFLFDPRGRQYVQIIKITAVTSIFCIVASKLNVLQVGPPVLILLSIFTIYIVSRLWGVGVDTFNALEPQNALRWITRDIFHSIKNVTPSSFQWKQPAIQHHHRKLTMAKIDLAKNLILFGNEEMKISNDQLIATLIHLSRVLYHYPDFRKQIPTNSFWYEAKIQFQDWDISTSFEILIALQTGTPLSPKTTKNYIWLEEKILDIVVTVLNNFSEKKEHEMFLEGYGIFVNVVEKYGKSFDKESIQVFFDNLDNNAGEFIYSDNTGKNLKQTETSKVALADTQGRLGITPLMGLLSHLANHGNIEQVITNIKWDNRSSIYRSGLPYAILAEIEILSEQLRNEKMIEGYYVSTQWYIKMLCVQKYLFCLQQYFEYLKSLHADFFQTKVDELIKHQQWIAAAQLMTRWTEFSSKYSHLVNSMHKHFEDLSKFRYVKDLTWPEFDINNEVQIASTRKKEISDCFIQLLPEIEKIEKRDYLPDYFGQAMVSGFEACYESCEENDVERLKRILPIVFSMSSSACKRTLQKVQNWNNEESKYIYATEPIINLVELSGYIKLYAELYQNSELWEVIKKCWVLYFQIPEIDTKTMIKALAEITNNCNMNLIARPQQELRAQWKQSFCEVLQKKGLISIPSDHNIFGFSDEKTTSKHPSSLIRVVSPLHGSFGITLGQEVFIMTYLSNHKDAEEVEFFNKVPLKELIHREEEKNGNQQQNNE